jgi:FtsP/CotA-like multicopper oxidase with cupredoxin domain
MDFFNRKLTFPDGSEHEMWSFEGNKFGRQSPGPRADAGGPTVPGTVKPSKRVHTIHWHGIEPDPRNDGVGHTSFEVTGHYTYQWRPDVGVPGNPNRGGAGTYFYHCHVNTPLHVQMGMFGPIVVDPPKTGCSRCRPVPAVIRLMVRSMTSPRKP